MTAYLDRLADAGHSFMVGKLKTGESFASIDSPDYRATETAPARPDGKSNWGGALVKLNDLLERELGESAFESPTTT